MHNLSLRTAKRIIEKWRSSGLITDAHLAKMQLDADKLVLPEDYMPLGTKIGLDFSFIKANKCVIFVCGKIYPVTLDMSYWKQALLPSTLPLALKGEISKDESKYEHLLKYYRKKYDDQTLVHYCQAGHSDNFVNNWIQKFESINFLGQIYKSKTKNQCRSFIQVLFETSDSRSIKLYADQIQYLSVNTVVNSFASQQVLLQPRAGEGVEINEVRFEDDSMNTILSVHRICYPVAVGKHLSLEGKV
ncbi:hypothetical protein PHYBLDRAFT_73447 [Phycomyces blakesleeanus NRRL 1555(-)]|uniref:Uncharacterized protein n=1 Tax=Phycomyces blakesleeanus (strain ATCC 8743b / DSM 1359 / FGSC 10004 / NBRC 33097 / NRRL 1555) TaxID=763407 RepID=A0A162QB53_PHYB8|nr:hypothetical protein PHYBLDRAFT_73447 [Phycomyces blakesleeanus NRRL 1555(-)]OAD81556.1 hypothetical protein PHYBLDRAFT_73447 [Phycomyces blakesleeanus NRRL 1555(-)]|eukprot:XP_018299596.1 hypothetical protein PHYBLDRAFT_73447 [Phycomyces blakesleeanus NRRL 1555(-)]